MVDLVVADGSGYGARMLTNEQILEEIEARRARTEAALKKVTLPDALARLMEHVQKLPESAVKSLADDLIKSFGLWSRPKATGARGDEVYAACGFEWYYDGTDMPYPLGFGCTKISPEPSAKGVTDSMWVKDDYLAGAEFDGYVFGDTGDFDFETICGPFYALVTDDDFDEDEHEEAADLVENLFLLHQLEALQQAASIAVKSEAFRGLKTTERFYLVARNHDDLGFIFAVID